MSLEQLVPDWQQLTHGQRQTVIIVAGFAVAVVSVLAFTLLMLAGPMFCIAVLIVCCVCGPPAWLPVVLDDMAVQQQQQPHPADNHANCE